MKHVKSTGNPSSPEAIRYLKLSANQRCGFALFELGRLHTEGIGVEKDEKMAQRYFRMASQQNLLEECEFGAQVGQYADQFYLAWMYEHGVYVEKDIEAAKDLYKKSAEQGFSLAKDALTRIASDSTEM